MHYHLLLTSVYLLLASRDRRASTISSVHTDVHTILYQAISWAGPTHEWGAVVCKLCLRSVTSSLSSTPPFLLNMWNILIRVLYWREETRERPCLGIMQGKGPGQETTMTESNLPALARLVDTGPGYDVVASSHHTTHQRRWLIPLSNAHGGRSMLNPGLQGIKKQEKHTTFLSRLRLTRSEALGLLYIHTTGFPSCLCRLAIRIEVFPVRVY